MITKPYKKLRKKMGPQARAAAAKKTKSLAAKLTDGEVRTSPFTGTVLRRHQKTTG